LTRQLCYFLNTINFKKDEPLCENIMNICMFTNTYLPHVGGVARSVHTFSRDLQRKGHQVLIVAPTFAGDDADNSDNDMILRVPAIQNFNGSDFSMRIPVPFYINEKLDAFAPDIIHSHHPYLLGDAAFRAARRRRLPLVFTHHTRYEQYTHYVAGDNDNFKQFARNLSTMYANLCDQVAAPSQSIADLIKKRGVSTPVTQIPTGVDTQFFASGDAHGFKKTYRIPENAVVIGHVGRLAPEKNLAFLARSVARSMGTLEDTWFCVAGDGPDRQTIHDIFTDCKLAHRLVLTGNLTGRTLADAYQAMDLFVFSSQSETQGMVLTEAMAAKTPVIALDGPGVREVVENQKNGRLLPGDADQSAFSRAIRDAVSDSEKLRTWQAHARQTALKFSRQACVDKLLDLYTTAVSPKDDRAENEDKGTEPWESFLVAIQAEWELIAEKAQSLTLLNRDDGT
jgi:glycosyltransferase involved in cell wall biosynthesis